MKNRTVSIVTVSAFLLLFSPAAGIAYGADGAGFTDVPETAWYYEDVRELQTQGMINGYEDGTFRPQNNVTYAEAYKLIFECSDVAVRERQAGEFWAQNYMEKAQKYGLAEMTTAGAAVVDPNAVITRAEVAETVTVVFGLDDGSVDTDEYGDITGSVFADTAALSANLLYETGIIKGIERDGALYFDPEAGITRAEIGAILLRIQSFRAGLGILSLEEMTEATEEETGLTGEAIELLADSGSFLPEAVMPEAPQTEEEFINMFLYMAKEDLFSVTFQYEGISFHAFKTSDNITELKAAQEYVFSWYPEYFSTRNRMAYSLAGTGDECTLTVRLGSEFFENAAIREMQMIFFERAEETVTELIADGEIEASMDDSEKALVLFDWMIDNTEYDDDLQELSFTGYGQITSGTAVCQGYSATYNLLCKFLGIDIHGITGSTGEDHMWSKAFLDGEWVHVDTTWGDSYGSKKANYDYFAADSAFMKKTHTWDEDLFGE